MDTVHEITSEQEEYFGGGRTCRDHGKNKFPFSASPSIIAREGVVGSISDVGELRASERRLY